MTKKTRLIILLICIICFSAIAPILVAYSMGYRFDFEKMKIVATGGIYVRTFPSADIITIDSNISEKPGFLANSIFVQSLLPKNHTVFVIKDGYHDYSKTLTVEENKVTKLENILLIKNKIKFETVLTAGPTIQLSPFDKIEKYIIKNSNLYYSNATENATLTATQKTTPVIKGSIAFSLMNNNIIWLGSDGFLYQTDQSNLSTKPTKLILTPLKISKDGYYKIATNGQNIFVINNGNLSILNTKINSLDDPYGLAKDVKISPDGKNIIFYNDKDIYILSILKTPVEKNILYKSSEKISDITWLNNDYIIFTTGDKIIVSEIDYRGSNINNVTLNETVTLSPDKKIDIKSPKIYFDQGSQKLYILTGKTLLLSEKITP